jgi:co-chaperonin GroES (HSP10)
VRERVRPIRNRVVILPDPLKKKIGTIWIPDNAQAKEKLHTGVVVAMGPGMWMSNGGTYPMPDIQIGQRVFYYPAGAQKRRQAALINGDWVDDVEHDIVVDGNISAVIEEEQPAAE